MMHGASLPGLLALLQGATAQANARPVIGGVAIGYFVIVAMIGIGHPPHSRPPILRACG